LLELKLHENVSQITLVQIRYQPTSPIQRILGKMARNEEKAQSMLFRFREAQAAELGIGIRKNERRPRVAASVKSLKDCERWRGEVLREISRKVSKIQDCECLESRADD
jgi:pre-mRNA-splicing factor ISY1